MNEALWRYIAIGLEGGVRYIERVAQEFECPPKYAVIVSGATARLANVVAKLKTGEGE